MIIPHIFNLVKFSLYIFKNICKAKRCATYNVVFIYIFTFIKFILHKYHYNQIKKPYNQNNTINFHNPYYQKTDQLFP